MEELKFTDSETGETFSGFGRMLAESRIFEKNYSEARARFYQVENRNRLATIPDYLLVAVLGPDEVMVEKFNDAFHFASWMRNLIQEDLLEPGENVLFMAMQKIIRDAAANSLDFHKIHMNIVEYRQILTGKKKLPEAAPEPIPIVKKNESRKSAAPLPVDITSGRHANRKKKEKIMSNAVGNFVQKIVWANNGEEIDRSFLREFTYTETIDLSGPRLIMLFDDPDSILTDSDWFQIKVGDVLELTFRDSVYRDAVDIIVRFVILTMPKDGIQLTFNCFQEDVYKLKMPASTPRLFVNKSARDILYALIPGLNGDGPIDNIIVDMIDDFPVVEDYHLLPGMRPSLMIRQMAREHGAMAFFSRNKFYFRTLVDLRDGFADEMDERICYEYNNIQGENQITHMEVLNIEPIIRDRIVRKYIGWDMEKGIIKADCKHYADDGPIPVEFAGVSNQITLSNLLECALPVLDLTMIGDGRLEPGLPLEFGWHLNDTARPFDEKLPGEGVVSAVSHYCTGDKYYCRAKIVIPMEEWGKNME